MTKLKAPLLGLHPSKRSQVKHYRIMNRVSKRWWHGKANSAQEACAKAGWVIGNCWVREYSPKGYGGQKNPTDRPELGRHPS